MTHEVERLAPQFVEFIPEDLQDGILYISIEFTTTAHKCACGCGCKVVLPLHPKEWHLLFDGKHVTIRPSVGNWGFECRSHYLITRDKIVWAADWTEEQVLAGRRRDEQRRTIGRSTPTRNLQTLENETPSQKPGMNWYRRLLGKFCG